jgi:anti-sigma B factor antagonist
MNIEKDSTQGIIIMKVGGRLDGDSTETLEKEVLDVLNAGSERLLMDFSDLEYINSSGLRILVMAFQRLKQNGGVLGVCSLKDYILEVFDISGYNRLFSLYPTRDDAVSDMRG